MEQSSAPPPLPSAQGSLLQASLSILLEPPGIFQSALPLELRDTYVSHLLGKVTHSLTFLLVFKQMWPPLPSFPRSLRHDTLSCSTEEAWPPLQVYYLKRAFRANEPSENLPAAPPTPPSFNIMILPLTLSLASNLKVYLSFKTMIP